MAFGTKARGMSVALVARMLFSRCSISHFIWPLLALACASADPAPWQPSAEDPPETTYVLADPEIVAVAPTQLAVGDRIQVIGQGMVPPDYGSMTLRLSGKFVGEGATREGTLFDAELALEYVNPGIAELEFGPDVIFSQYGDEIGVFTGTATIISRAGEQEKRSSEQPVTFQVMPSLIIEELHSVDANCAPVTAGTVGDVTVTPPVQIGQQTYTEVTLHRLAIGKLAGQGPAYATFGLEAVATDGRRAQRVASMAGWNEAEIEPFNGNQRLAERYPAEQVSGCFYGGDIGRDLTYTEGQSESRTRSVSYRWDINNALSAGIQVGTSMHLGNGLNPVISYGVDVNASASLNATWSQTFGVDVAESVSTERHTGQNFSAHILPTFYGACYRQTERVEKSVRLVYHNKCGVSADIGEAVLTDWNWGFDIGTGPECPPRTHLLPAEKF